MCLEKEEESHGRDFEHGRCREIGRATTNDEKIQVWLQYQGRVGDERVETCIKSLKVANLKLDWGLLLHV
jgi:hypothetical protein